jgi:hypothetical protein
MLVAFEKAEAKHRISVVIILIVIFEDVLAGHQT